MAAPGSTDQLGVRAAHLHVVAPDLAARVAAPAYDTLPTSASGGRVQDPLSYLHVLRRRTDDPGHRASREALQRLLRSDVFDGGSGRRFAWYRLTAPDGHRQTGLIAEVAIADYDAGRIVRHEHTRADREEQLATYQQAVGADASPVALAYRSDPGLRRLGDEATADAPDVAFTAHNGVEHAVWTRADRATAARVADALATIDRLYVTDGHHRLAAASRVAAAGRARGAGPDAPDQWLLAALFPDDQLRILPFHRAVTRPVGVPTARLLADLATHVAVTAAPGPFLPQRPHTYCAWLDGAWYQLDAEADPGDDPLDDLDVTVLQRRVLGPVLSVAEPRFDPRLSYVAGDAEAVAAHCRRTRSIGFMLRPTSMDELMRVADAETVMPPKSTLFSPKTCAGVVLRLACPTPSTTNRTFRDHSS